MKTYKMLFTLLLIPVFVLVSGCKKDDESPVTPPTTQINEAELLAQYVEGNGDYIYSGASFVITASDFRTRYLADSTKLYIIDMRATADYNARHLRRAINVPMSGLWTHVKALNLATYDRVVVACYSGQTAAFAVSVIRSLLPLTDANKVVSLKWGMSAIDSTFAQNYWLGKISNSRAAQFITSDPPAKPAKGDLPALSTGLTNGKDILEARAVKLLNDGFNITISEAAVYSNLSGYFIVNYWPLGFYKDPGHIDGAYNYDPAGKPFNLANDLKSLPTNKPVVLYCYTGQTSAYVGAYLKMLGYDAKTLVYGANSMIYDKMKTVAGFPQANIFIPANEIKSYRDLLN